MSALLNATKAVYGLLDEAYTSTVTILSPDHKDTFQDYDYAAGQVVARYYQPQLLSTGGMAMCLATVDIAAEKAQDSIIQADKLLTTLGATKRAPSGAVAPRTTTIRGAGYWRTNVQFTILVDALSS